jgi:thiol-disulfide isomerase/thioredoxin
MILFAVLVSAAAVFYAWKTNGTTFAPEALKRWWPGAATSQVAPIALIFLPFWVTTTLSAAVLHVGARLFGGQGSFRRLCLWMVWTNTAFFVVELLTPLSLRVTVPLWIWKNVLSIALVRELYALSVGNAVAGWVAALIARNVLTIMLAIGAAIGFFMHSPKLGAGQALTPIDRPANLNWVVRTLDGRPVPMSEFAGKPLLINFWATWCMPCRLEMPSLEKLYDRLSAEGFVFLAITDEKPEKVQKYLAKRPTRLPIYLRDGGRPAGFDSQGIPATFVVSPEGRIVFLQEGATDWHSDKMVERLRSAVRPGSPAGGATDLNRSTLAAGELAISPPADLNFKSRADILEMRRKAVARYPGLAPAGYSPAEAVFGQIADGKPWWGLDGFFHYGQTPQSIEGPAEESRFILNPYILIGLREHNAYKGGTPLSENEAPAVMPTSVRWSADKKSATARFTLQGWNRFLEARRRAMKDEPLVLMAYNARDFGYDFLRVNAEKTDGVLFQVPSGLVPLRQFLHLGQSCGYPGGCNNYSPRQPELMFNVARLPARITVDLFRHTPAPRSLADFQFVLELE